MIEINYTLPGYPRESLLFTVTQADEMLKLDSSPSSASGKTGRVKIIFLPVISR